MKIDRENFGLTPDEKKVEIFTFENRNGMRIKITNYGARVTSVLAPDRSGKLDDIVLGYDNLDDYLKDEFYLGAIVGRYANRIAGGKFVLNNKQYDLTVNSGKNHLHGGRRGFDKVVWDAKRIIDDEGLGLKLSYISIAGEEGYPGRLNVDVIYILTDDNKLIIKYKAKADKSTPINLIHHSYFNLSGNFKTDILGHQLYIDADTYLPVDENGIPSGKIEMVSGTPFDFKQPLEIGPHIDDEHIQLQYGNGYDHNWILNNTYRKVDFQAELYEPQSGRLIQVKTMEPGLQFYSGNFLNKEKTNGCFGFRSGLCLETQHFPDSPNHPEFPSTILKRDEVYKSQTVYKFLVK